MAGEGALRAVEAMTALAREHLSAFEAGAASLPPTLRPAFLPLALTRLRSTRWASPAQILRGGQRPTPGASSGHCFAIASRGWQSAESAG